MNMPDDAHPEQPAKTEWPVLADDCCLYCAAKNLEAIDKVSGEFLRGAFMRKSADKEGKPRDVNGVSVTVSDGLTHEQTITYVLGEFTVQGIGKLLVGDVRGVAPARPLDAVQDRPNHANIKGLPAFGENILEAERLAGLLAKKTRPVYIKGKGILPCPTSQSTPDK